jgi:hypothetical protein
MIHSTLRPDQAVLPVWTILTLTRPGHNVMQIRDLPLGSRPSPVDNSPTGAIEGIANMRTFLLACLAAAVIATGAAVILYQFQKPAAVAFSTSAVRI